MTETEKKDVILGLDVDASRFVGCAQALSDFEFFNLPSMLEEIAGRLRDTANWISANVPTEKTHL